MRRSSTVGGRFRPIPAALALMGLIGLSAATSASAVEAAAPTISVELNKLEPQESGCRIYIVLTNGGDEIYDAFKLDFVLFDPQGVIIRRLAVDAAPLRAAKRAVKLFDVQGSPCEGIGTVLVNDVLECGSAAGPVVDCVSRVAVSSRAGIEFLK